MRKILIFLIAAAASFGMTAAAQAKQAPPQSPDAKLTIAGPPLASERQAVNFIKKSNPDAKLNCTVEEIVRLYYKEAGDEGIRPDVALSQALLETGFFRYGGDVKPAQNNFCGLGSVGGGAKGASFATPALGVRAHIQHLLAYSSKKAPKTAIVDPRYKIVKDLPHIFGVCVTWHDLNGRWARAGIPYGERIIDIHQRMLQTEPRGKPPARGEDTRKG
ncbi:MAG: glucosaminidase domain-containing protein, partial [Acidaminococcales bacterium]|nr:glucosaminidase domain-containing protein [Acidaminococcales bacterium]